MENKKMFSAKQEKLFETKKASVKNKETENPFVSYGMPVPKMTTSGNGSLKYETSGSEFVNQFASVAKYKSPRHFSEINDDMVKLWSIDKEMTVKFVIYLRMITRQGSLFDGSKTNSTQRGAGLKHEAITRMIWLAVNQPDVFYKNIEIFITAGSWNDVIKMLSYDLQYNSWSGRTLNWDFFGKLILAGLENPNTTNLLRKYLPQIKANSKCNTLESQADNLISKWICSLIFGSKKEDSGLTYKLYRELKKNGNAHKWQQFISKGMHDLVDFNTVHGRALASMVSGNYLKNNGLEDKYDKWISSKPVAKFTGFPYELAVLLGKSKKEYQLKTINSQFNNLVEMSKNGLSESNIRPISVIDCSGSMSSPMYIGNGKVGNMSSIEVAFSSAIFFNEMMSKNSPFYDTYLEFSNITKMHKFNGFNFCEKYLLTSRNGWGGTNFSSVFDFFVDFKLRNPDVSEELIPNFIVCFSDGEFDFISKDGTSITNIQAGREKLAKVYSKEFCENFGICFVDLPNTFYQSRPATKFETFGDCKNVFYFSGYDLSPLGFLFGVEGKLNKETGEVETPKTAEELFYASMNQELLNMVSI